MAKGACMVRTHVPLAHSPERQREDRMSRSPSRMKPLFPIVTVYAIWKEDTQRIVTNQQMTVGYLRNQESGGIQGFRGPGKELADQEIAGKLPSCDAKTSAC